MPPHHDGTRPARPRGTCARALAGCVLLAAGLGCGNDNGGVTGSGTIEMDEVDVASQVGGRLEWLRVDEGDAVRKGDTLAVLDQGEVLAALGARAAEAERAVSQLRDLQAGARSQELDAAQADLEAANAQWQLAQAEAARAETLYLHHVVSAAELDRARSTRDAAVARRAGLRERHDLLRAGSRTDQVRAAREAETAARAQLDAARSRAHELVLVAPIDGVVLLKNLNQGELVAPNVPVVTLGNPDRLWMRVYVGAPKIGRVRRGDTAVVRVTGDKHEYRGHVVEIASKAEFTPRAALTEEERANLVFGVKIVIEPSGGALKPGLPADARIQPGAAGTPSGGRAP
jgi:HlyD family secretion protein